MYMCVYVHRMIFQSHCPYIYTHLLQSNFKLGESKHFVSCIWPMGYSFIHSLWKSQYKNKTLVLSVLMENFQAWTDVAGILLGSVGSLPWTFRSRNFLFHFCPHLLPHGNFVTNALLKGTIFLPLPFPMPSSLSWNSERIRNVSAEGNWEGRNGRELLE